MLKKICLTGFLVFLLAVTAFSGTESAESKVADVDATATTGESGTADAELTGAAEIQSTMQADAAASESPAGQKSAEEIARELANPNTPLATLSLKNQYRKYDGDLPGADRQSNYSMLFQPTFPFALENGDVIFFRPAFPLLSDQPYFDLDTLDFDSDSGLGDIGADLGYGRTSKTGLLWAAGIVMSAPTATSSHFGSDRWTLGPELLIGKINPKSVFGIFPNHQWDVAGSSDAIINRTSTQIFANYLPKGGWSVGTSPIISYDWEQEQWTVPLNLSVSKTVILNGNPWKFGLEFNYYLENSDLFGEEWSLSFNIAPVVRNVFAEMF